MYKFKVGDLVVSKNGKDSIGDSWPYMGLVGRVLITDKGESLINWLDDEYKETKHWHYNWELEIWHGYEEPIIELVQGEDFELQIKDFYNQ